jgi:uncharacterized membrane protein YcgQ (UPF0703/DUF1980 family)
MEQNKRTDNFFTKAFRDHTIPSWWAIAGIIFLFINIPISIFIFAFAGYTLYKEKKPGGKFTLIKLIVWIAIIGIISSVVLASLNSARMKGQTTQTSTPATQTTETTTYNNPPSLCSDIASLKKQATTVNFKELIKNPDSFNGKIVKFTGQILQIQESNNYGVIRLAVTKDSYGWSSSDVVYVEYQNQTNAVADDIVTVYGQLTGTKTYKSQANYSITIPSMDACIVEKYVAKPITQNQQKTPAVVQTQTTSEPTNNLQTNTVTTPTLPPLVAYKGRLNDMLPGIQFFVGTPQDYTSTDTYTQPASGNKFVSEFIQINNQSNIQVYYSPSYFELVDSNGGKYDRTYSSQPKPIFSSGTLNPGGNVSGNIVYEVPVGISASQFIIHLEQYIGDTHVITDFK